MKFELIFTFVRRLLCTLFLFVLGTLILWFNLPFHLGFSMYLLVPLVLVYMFFGFASVKLAFDKEHVGEVVRNDVVGDRRGLIPLFMYPSLNMALFVIVASYISLGFPECFSIDGSESYSAYNSTIWVLFSGQVLLNAIFLDLFESYKLTITNLDYHGFLMMTFVFVHKTIVGVYFWSLLISVYRSHVGTKNEADDK